MTEEKKVEEHDEVESITKRKKTPCGWAYVTIGQVDGKTKQIFCKLGKGGTCPRAFTEAISALASLAKQYGAPLSSIKKCLIGVTCSSGNGKEILSCPDAIGQALEEV